MYVNTAETGTARSEPVFEQTASGNPFTYLVYFDDAATMSEVIASLTRVAEAARKFREKRKVGVW